MDDPTASPSGQIPADQPRFTIPAEPGQIPAEPQPVPEAVPEEPRPDSTTLAEPVAPPPAPETSPEVVPEAPEISPAPTPPVPEPTPTPEPQLPESPQISSPPTPPPPIPEPTINIEPVAPPPEPTPEVSPQPSNPPSPSNLLEPSVPQVLAYLKTQLDQKRVKANQARTDQRGERLNKIISFVQSHGPVKNQDVRDLLHVSQSTATGYLKSLVSRGNLVMEKKSNFTTYH